MSYLSIVAIEVTAFYIEIVYISPIQTVVFKVNGESIGTACL